MQLLKEILSLFDKNQLESLLPSDSLKGTKTQKLLKGIIDGTIKSDSEASIFLFGEGVGSKDKYGKLKKRAHTLLLDQLFLKPTGGNKDYVSEHESCLKNTAVVKMLYRRSKRSTALTLASNTLKTALKYQFTEICRDLSMILMLGYSIGGDIKYKNRYKSIYEEQLSIGVQEVYVNELLNEVAFLLSKHKKPTGKVLNQIISLLDEIKNCNGDSYFIKVVKFQARSIKANIQNDHDEIFRILNEAMVLFESFDFDPPKGYLFNILNKTTPSLILTGMFSEAKKNIEKCLSIKSKGSYNWHISLYYQMILGFYSQDYDLAKDSILFARKYNKDLPVHFIELWKIAELYWYFASLLNLVEYKGKIRIGKLLNEFSVYNKDKSGANASIKLMAEFIIALARGNRDVLIDKSESLRLYAYHHLKNESNQRSNKFFWIVQQISGSEFNADLFKNNTAEKFGELKSIPAKIEDLETEIIPFESLYLLIINILEKNNDNLHSCHYF